LGNTMSDMGDAPKIRVLIVGGGFGGIEVARKLRGLPVQVTILDRRNYHLFQPLLYQVATATLSPADIAASIRSVVSDIENCRVVLAKVRGVDLKAKRLNFERISTPYDWLVLAAGATHSYFGHDEWAVNAPGLKTIEDATEIRRRILLAFESAEYEGDEALRDARLTFAIVGGGPTGVELAGAIKEIASFSIARDFRHIDTKSTKVILLQGGDRLLPQFSSELSEKAKTDLETMGVQVRLNAKVTSVSADGVMVGTEFIPAGNVFWAAGVKASPLAETLGVPVDKSGRVYVNPDLSVPGFKEVFVIGDMAAARYGISKELPNGKEVPGVAQAAIQMGRHVGEIIAAEIRGEGSPRKSFEYWNKGSMATIGKSRAVAEIGPFRFSGFIAWLLWGAIHVLFLVGFRNRLGVIASWFWNWLISARDARLITGDARLNVKEVRPGEVILQMEGENSAEPTV